MNPPAPTSRMRIARDRPVNPGGDFVLYWMVAQRRTRWNFGLQHAVHLAAALRKPLVVLEALRLDYRWASARLHRFVLDGMADNAARLAAAGVTHHAYVEPEKGAGAGLLAALADRAAVVVTDDWPSFFVPAMVAAGAARCPVQMIAVDSNGILPLSATDRAYTTAHSFRRHLQKTLLPHLSAFPVEDPLLRAGLPPARALPAEVLRRWPCAAPALLSGTEPTRLAALPVDKAVAPTGLRGGAVAAEDRAAAFLAGPLHRYATARNDVEAEVGSGLSPYLHFGHLSPHQLLSDILEAEDWQPDRLSDSTAGSRAGWWGLSPSAEAFLDQLITWRELGFVFQHHNPDSYERFDSLPDWALETLDAHRGDPRPHRYSLSELEEARSHDPIWNAAQRQLLREGRIHNYLRMLWAKKVLEWSHHPEQALQVLIELNNRYALDGRDPNSTSGIFWCFGRFDRAWGPERPIFGKIRYMSSDSTRRKLDLTAYLRRYSAEEQARQGAGGASPI